jgi:hypothetical protein
LIYVLFIVFSLKPYIYQIRRQDLFFAEQKMKRRSDQYEKFFNAVMINTKKHFLFFQYPYVAQNGAEFLASQ